MLNIPRLRTVTIFLCGLTIFGCARKPTGPSGTAKTEAMEDPWRRSALQFRGEIDVVAAQRLLGSLRSDLSLSHDEKIQPVGLTSAEEAEYKKLLAWNDDDLREASPPSFTTLDPQYLAEMYYCRDVVRAMETSGLPPAVRAERAFDWLCRQVVLSPWMQVEQTRSGQTVFNIRPPVPPSYVLKRGSGSGLERAYVFVALLQQLELDACFLGADDAARRSWDYRPDWQKNDEVPQGPFWGVGVRIGSDIMVFDPWRGELLRGADGKFLPLAKVVADPALLKSWRDDKEQPFGVPDSVVKETIPILSIPPSAVAPRLARLEKELAIDAEAAVRLHIHPQSIVNRFKTDAQCTSVKFWTPPELVQQIPAEYARVLGNFLPTELGGTERAKGIYKLYREKSGLPYYVVELSEGRLPKEVFMVLVQDPEISKHLQGQQAVFSDIVRGVGEQSKHLYETKFLTSPTPRELIQRGRWADVVKTLVELRTEYSSATDRLRQDKNRDESLRNWMRESMKMRSEYLQAQENSKDDALTSEKVKEQFEAAVKKIKTGEEMMVDVVTTRSALAESTYLLCLAMHEQAEGAELRAARPASGARRESDVARDRERASAAWKEASGWWGRYEQFRGEQNSAYPGRGFHTARLAARAASRATK